MIFDALYGVAILPEIEYFANATTTPPKGCFWPLQHDSSLPRDIIECRAGGTVLTRIRWDNEKEATR